MNDLDKTRVIAPIFDEYGLAKELIDFYESEVCDATAAFVFVVPRKCLTELKVLLRQGVIQFGYSDDQINANRSYGTNKSFIMYVNKIKKMLAKNENFEIAVIDDIIVHGRGICLFLDNFLLCFSEEERAKVCNHIKVSALVRNARLPFLQKHYPDIYEKRLKTWRTYSEQSDLKRISDLFLNSFAVSMTPNTSFINSWFIRADKDSGKLYQSLKYRIVEARKTGQIYEENISHLNEYMIHVFACCEEKEFSDLVEFACVRCYTSKLEQIVLIPYVFLKPLSKENIDAVYNDLQNSSYERLVSGFLEQMRNIESEAAYILKVQYLTRVISEIYGCRFLTELQDVQHDLKWSELIEEDADALRFSYGNEFYHIDDVFFVLNEAKDNLRPFVFQTSIDECFSEEREALNLFERSFFFKDELKCQLFIDNYFSFNCDYDDKKAFEGQNRLKGISPGQLKKELLKLKLYKEDIVFYGHLLCCMDSGKAALTIDCMNNYYVSILKSGEQAYRIRTADNQWAIKYLAKMESVLINLCMQNKIANYMTKYVNELLKEQCIEQDDLEMLNSLIEEVECSRNDYDNKVCNGVPRFKIHRTYMKDYFVPRIEEIPVENYDKQLEKVYNRTMNDSK